MGNPVLIFAEQRGGNFRKAAFEAVSEGKRLATALGVEAVAVVVGSGMKDIAGSLGQYGADRVLVADHADFKSYAGAAYAKAVIAAAKAANAQAVIMSATSMGKDLSAQVAGGLETSVAQDCIGVVVDGGKIVVRRPTYAGKAIVTVAFNRPPAVITLRPKVFAGNAPDASKSAPVENLAINAAQTDFAAMVKEIVAAAGKKMDLTEADVIVSGGRGMKGPENYKMLETLADALGGVVGASRAAVDAGWRPHDDQVGQTGKTVCPTLYIACGISGAIQHMAGMGSSKFIVAINKDPEAPIFKVANYGIVGDLFEVVPVLTTEMKKAIGA
jgi:electron transfer flavoprotein alpha subunit